MQMPLASSFSYRSLLPISWLLLFCSLCVLRFYPQIKLVYLLLAIAIAVNGVVHKRSLYRQGMQQVEEAMVMLVALGIGVLWLNFIAQTDELFGFGLQFFQTVKPFVQLIAYFAAILFWIYGLLFVEKILLQNANAGILFVRYWEIILGISLLLPLVGTLLPQGFAVYAIGLGLVLFLPLSVQLQWIVWLNRKDKWLSVLYLSILLGVNIGLWLLSANASPSFYQYFQIFFSLLIGGTSLYFLNALISLIFNLPLSATIEEIQTEARSFREMNALHFSSGNVQDGIAHLLNICLENAKADAAVMVEYMPEGEDKVYVKNISQESVEDWVFRYYPQFTLALHNTKQYPIYWENVADIPYKSLLLYPAWEEEKLVGQILLCKKNTRAFSQKQREKVRWLVEQYSVLKSNQKLMEKSRQLAQKEAQFQLARDIQQALLPQAFSSPYLEVAAYNQTADEVGGDYYDYFVDEHGNSTFVIADVAGSGTSAAFYMAEMKGIFSVLVRQSTLSLSEKIELMNKTIAASVPNNVFITLMLVQILPQQHTLHLVRAGHPPMLYFQQATKQHTRCEPKGIGLGILRNESILSRISVVEYTLADKDIILLFTDGLIENKHPQSREEWGIDGLEKAFAQAVHSETTEGILQQILHLREKDGYNPAEDDECIIVVKYNSEQN
ncbi:MAG: SpoIIE family protein phosphatase [Chitinophagales bacterium]|nr:SpoIIE family protein phosphatase [Bacteroidota bacterium]MCB9044035.1 SpoIIE family protein phosphatase [Chitinophagales bacterium]